MQIEMWPIEKLIFCMRNPRKTEATELTGRVCYGIELGPKYVDIAVGRWQSLSGQKAVLEGDGRTFAQVAWKRLREVWDAAA
jgi:hypothetical protein